MTYPFEASLNGASINITLVMDHSVFTDTGPKHYDYLKPHPLFHNPNNNDDAQGGIARTIWITRWNMWKLGAPQRQNISLVDYLKIHADNPFNDVNETTITQRDTVIVFLDPNSANGNRLLTQIKIDARVSIFWGEHVIGGKLFFFVPTISPGGNPSMGVATDFLGCALTRAYSSRTSDFLDG